MHTHTSIKQKQCPHSHLKTFPSLLLLKPSCNNRGEFFSCQETTSSSSSSSSSMDTAQWPQEIVVKPMEEIVVQNGSGTCSSKANSLERRVRPQKEQALNCPRCNSTNTKFCYYNNYSLSQPRYFCKTCRRYWTEGGSLRNIPVGGGSRKNKRSSSSSSSASSNNSSSSKKLPDLVPPTNITNTSQSTSRENPKIHEGQDLNLAFPSHHHDLKTISELIQVPNFHDNNNSKSHLSALELLTGISSRGLNSFMPMSDPSTIYSSGFSLQEFKPTLNFSLDGLGGSSSGGGGYGSLQGVQETSGRLLFPFEDLKQVSTTSDDHMEQTTKEQGDSNGYWNGVLGSGSW